MPDHTLAHAALRRRHTPLDGGGLNQHHAGCSTALADIVLRFTDTSTAAGGEVAPDTLSRQILPRRGLLRRDLGPIATQFFGHHLRKSGQRALPHFGAGDAHHHGVVGPHHHPGIQLENGLAMGDRLAGKGQMKGKAQSASGRAGQELPAGNCGPAHAMLPSEC